MPARLCCSRWHDPLARKGTSYFRVPQLCTSPVLPLPLSQPQTFSRVKHEIKRDMFLSSAFRRTTRPFDEARA